MNRLLSIAIVHSLGMLLQWHSVLNFCVWRSYFKALFIHKCILLCGSSRYDRGHGWCWSDIFTRSEDLFTSDHNGARAICTPAPAPPSYLPMLGHGSMWYVDHVLSVTSPAVDERVDERMIRDIHITTIRTYILIEVLTCCRKQTERAEHSLTTLSPFTKVSGC